MWIQWYRSIYEMDTDERPDQETINSDAELDAYLEELQRERQRKRRKLNK